MNKLNSPKARNTRQRQLILCCISEGRNCTVPGHKHTISPDAHAESYTADEIEKRLTDNGEKIGKATIYRYLHRLCEENAVRKYITGNGSACYQYISGAKDSQNINMVCEICGRVIHVDSNDILKATTVEGSEDYSFSVNCSRTVFYGTCSECSKKQESGDTNAE